VFPYFLFGSSDQVQFVVEVEVKVRRHVYLLLFEKKSKAVCRRNCALSRCSSLWDGNMKHKYGRLFVFSIKVLIFKLYRVNVNSVNLMNAFLRIKA
jgi:hypothetical protein